MNPIGMFENPAMAEQQMLNQLQAEQQHFWYQFRVRPPQNDWERHQAIGALRQRYGWLSMLQGDATFLSNQGYGRLLMAVNQELNAISATRNQYVNALQVPYYPQPSASVQQSASSAPTSSPAGSNDLLARLARSSAEQEKIRRRMVRDCVHCGLPTRGNSQCPHCGRDQ
jgi:hypothetical protein